MSIPNQERIPEKPLMAHDHSTNLALQQATLGVCGGKLVVIGGINTIESMALSSLLRDRSFCPGPKGLDFYGRVE